MKKITTLIVMLIAINTISAFGAYSPSTSGSFSDPTTWGGGGWPSLATDNITVANGDANINISLSADRVINNFTINSGNINNLTFSSSNPVTDYAIEINNFYATDWNSPGLNLIVEKGVTLIIDNSVSYRCNTITVKDGGSIIFNSDLAMTGNNANLIVESGGSIDINGKLTSNGGANSNFVVINGTMEVDEISTDGIDFVINDGGTVSVVNDATFKNPDVTINTGGALNVGNNIKFDGGWPNIGIVDGEITAGGDFYILWGLTITGDGKIEAATYSSGGTIFGVQPASSIAPGTSIENAYYSAKSGVWNGNKVWSRSEGGTAINGSPSSTSKAIILDGHIISTPNNTGITVKNLTIRSGGKFIAKKGSTINNYLDVKNQAVIEMSKTLTVNGSMNIDGTILPQNANLVIANGGTITGGGAFNSDKLKASGSGSQIEIKGNTTFNCSEFSLISKDNDVLDINSGVTVTNAGRIMSYGNIIGNGTWINSTDAYLQIDGKIFTNTTGILEASANNNTIYYTSSEDAQITVGIKTPTNNDFYHLTVAGTDIFEMDNDLNIAGNLNISGATLECAGNDINLGGDWISSGTFTSNTGTNLVTFNGTTNQTIIKSGGESFYEVDINKIGGTVIINNNVTVSDALTLTNGNVVTGNNIFELGTNVSNVGTLTHAGNRSWINGNFKRWISSAHEGVNVLFPIGTDTYYRPATPKYTGISGGSITATFVESNPGNAGFDDGTTAAGNPYLNDASIPVINTFIDGYWDLNSTGLSATNYNIKLDGEGFNAFAINNGTRLLTRANSTSDWTADGSHTPPATGDVVARTNLTTLPAQYCFADTSNCSAPEALTITGSSNVCTNDINEIYSVTNNPGSTYTWTIKNGGGTIISGQGNNQITVNWGITGQTDQIIVVEENNCTIGEEYTLDVNIHSIKPVEIIGDNRVAAGQTGVIYSVQNYTNYDFTWGVTDGTITADNNNKITVNWDNTDGIGSINVYAQETTMGCIASATIDTNVQRYLTINSIADGNWGDETTWDCNCVPTKINSVKISHNVATKNTAWTINDILIESSGNIEIEKPFYIMNDFTIDGETSGSSYIYWKGIDANLAGIGFINNFIYFASGNKYINSNSYLTINSGMKLYKANAYNYGNVTINSNLDADATGTCTWVNEENSILSITGNLVPTGILDASATNNTIKYTGGAQAIKQPVSNTYYNLEFGGGSTKLQGFDMTLLGNLTNTLSTHNTNNNDITIAGNWTNTGTFNEGSGTVTFNGDKIQTINNAEVFNNLVVNNTANSVTMVDNVTVNNEFTLTSGNILLGTGKKLDLNSDKFTYTDGKIVGVFEQTISTAGTKQFPMGSLTSLNPINFDLTGSPSGVIRSEFIQGDAGGTYTGLTEDGLNITGYHTEGYWKTYFSFNPGSYDMNVTGDGIDSIISATRILNRVSGATAWALNGTHANAFNDICYRNGVTLGSNTYEFALGKTNCQTFSPADSIIGLANVCKNEAGILYSIPNNGNNYQWTVSTDAVSFSGATTNKLTVDWGNTASITGKVSVVESNSCYVAPAVEKSVWIHSLPTQNLVGSDSVFDNTSNWAYSVDTRTGYTYDWDVTGPGTANVSNGQGTGNVQIEFGDPGTYTITVDGYYSSCSTQKAATISMNVEVFASYETQANGAWNVGSTWLGGSVPPANANAKILHNVTIPTASEIKHLLINGGSITQSSDFTVTGHYKNDGSHNGGGNDLFLYGDAVTYTISGTGNLTNFDVIHIDDNYEIMTGTTLSATATALTINNGYSIRNKGIITINGDIVAQGTSGIWINDANSSLTVSGDVFSAQGELYAKNSNSTITYSGAAQNINVSENGYWNLATSGSGTKTLTGITKVYGNLTIGASTTLDVSANNYTLQLEGDWNNSGTFNERNGSVQFLGSTDQNLTSSGDENFYNVVISQNSGLSTILNSNIVINGELRLTRGTIYTKENKVVVVDNATTNGGDADSFVEGKVQKNGDDNFVFPLGDNIRWARLGITFATPAYSVFIASYAKTVPVDTGNVTGLNNVSSGESWDLNKVSGNNVYLTLYCEDTAKSGITDIADLKLAHYSGGSWIEEVATASFSGASGTITTNNILTSYSPFTFGSGSATVNPLPVKFISISAIAHNSNIELNWATGTEINNNYFTVERSSNGKYFEEIAIVNGAGNSSVTLKYTIYDYNPLEGTAYYRIKQTDDNGEYAYSDIVSVYNNNNYINNDIIVYPNPYSSGDLVIETKNIPTSELLYLSLSSIKGNVVYKSNITNPESKKIILSSSILNNIADGLYIINITTFDSNYKSIIVVE